MFHDLFLDNFFWVRNQKLALTSYLTTLVPLALSFHFYCLFIFSGDIISSSAEPLLMLMLECGA